MTSPPEGRPPGPGPSSDPYVSPSAGPYGSPPPGPYGSPPPAGPYGSPPPSGPYGSPPGGPYGSPSGDPYAAPAPGPYGAPGSGAHGASPAGGYGQGPGYGTPPPQGPPTDVVSVVGLVLAFLLAPVGLVVSIVGLARTSGGRRRGRGFAVAGVIVSVVVSLLIAAVVVALVALGSYVEEQVGPGGVEELLTGDPFAQEPIDPSALLPLGQAAQVGDLRLTVTDVDLDADAAVTVADPDAPAPDGRYVLVTGTVENPSDSTQDVYAGLNIVYLSTDGAAYDEFTCDADVPGSAFATPALEPGGSAVVVWCLDVPVDQVGDGGVQATTLLDLTGSSAVVWADR